MFETTKNYSKNFLKLKRVSLYACNGVGSVK